MRSPLKLAQPGQSVESGVQFRHPLGEVAHHVARAARRRAAAALAGERGHAARRVAIGRPVVWPGVGRYHFAPICHSALLGSRLPELAHGLLRLDNQVMKAAGATDGMLTA